MPFLVMVVYVTMSVKISTISRNFNKGPTSPSFPSSHPRVLSNRTTALLPHPKA